MLGKLIGAQRLGKPFNHPSVMVGVLIEPTFSFMDSVVIEVQDDHGVIEERMVIVVYPSKSPHYETCEGFGHHKYCKKSWVVVAALKVFC